jgi:hypothetical protein
MIIVVVDCTTNKKLKFRIKNNSQIRVDTLLESAKKAFGLSGEWMLCRGNKSLDLNKNLKDIILENDELILIPSMNGG